MVGRIERHRLLVLGDRAVDVDVPLLVRLVREVHGFDRVAAAAGRSAVTATRARSTECATQLHGECTLPSFHRTPPVRSRRVDHVRRRDRHALGRPSALAKRAGHRAMFCQRVLPLVSTPRGGVGSNDRPGATPSSAGLRRRPSAQQVGAKNAVADRSSVARDRRAEAAAPKSQASWGPRRLELHAARSAIPLPTCR